MMRLESTFFQQSTQRVARELLGKTLVRRLHSGILLRAIVVEVEAYLSRNDPASHSHHGIGKKNATMFGPPGALYVYPIHTRHCMNVVTESEGRGAAVLLRAAEPISGIQEMWRGRFDEMRQEIDISFRDLTKLTQGPGRLCEALDIDRNQDGLDLFQSNEIWIEHPIESVEQRDWKIQASTRIGISQARDKHLRWFIDGNFFVSGRASQHTTGRHWCFGPFQ